MPFFNGSCSITEVIEQLYYTINQIGLLKNAYFTNQEFEFEDIDIKNMEYLLKLEKMIPENVQESHYDLLNEDNVLELFNDNQDIKQEYIMETNDEGMYSEIIQNNTEKRLMPTRIKIIIFCSSFFIFCMLIYIVN